VVVAAGGWCPFFAAWPFVPWLPFLVAVVMGGSSERQ
jgi:hypothetical protein